MVSLADLGFDYIFVGLVRLGSSVGLGWSLGSCIESSISWMSSSAIDSIAHWFRGCASAPAVTDRHTKTMSQFRKQGETMSSASSNQMLCQSVNEKIMMFS